MDPPSFTGWVLFRPWTLSTVLGVGKTDDLHGWERGSQYALTLSRYLPPSPSYGGGRVGESLSKIAASLQIMI